MMFQHQHDRAMQPRPKLRNAAGAVCQPGLECAAHTENTQETAFVPWRCTGEAMGAAGPFGEGMIYQQKNREVFSVAMLDE